MSRVYPLELT